MADYQDPRAPPRQRGYPDGNGYQQRDAAFSNIFGASPPGRSQTMTSSSMGSMMDNQGRTQTMSSTSSGMPRQPPPRSQNGYYDDRGQGPPRPRQGEPYQHQQQQNGYYPNQAPSGGQRHPSQQGQYMGQQQHDRRQYHDPRGPPGPRFDPRGPPPQVSGARSASHRFYQEGNRHPAAAMNSDSYRSQSLASVPRPQMYPNGAGGGRGRRVLFNTTISSKPI